MSAVLKDSDKRWMRGVVLVNVCNFPLAGMHMSSALRIRSLLAAVLLGLTGATACSDPLGPRDLTGTYVVTDLGSLITRDHRVIADTIFLYPDGTGSKREYVEIYAPNPAQQRFMSSDSWLEYRIEGSRLIVQLTSCGQPMCVDLVGISPISYTIKDDGLVSADGRLRYERR